MARALDRVDQARANYDLAVSQAERVYADAVARAMDALQAAKFAAREQLLVAEREAWKR